MATGLEHSGFRGDPKEIAALPAGRLDTALVLCIACVLIVNSHLEQFWPQSFLAVDGLLGNSLFYLMSGFGIGSSLLSRSQRCIPFLARRLVRIYPAVIIAVLLFVGLAGGRAYATVNGLPPWTPPQDCIAVAIPEGSNAGIGWTYVGGEFIAPPQPEPEPEPEVTE